MNNLIPSRVAAIIFAIAIGSFGIRNFIKAGSMDAIVPDYMPGGTVWLYITGTCLILAAIAIVLNNRLTKPACYLLALMLIIFVFLLHLKPALGGNPNNLLRDTAIAMGAIIIGNLAPTRKFLRS
jgi:putative oxidoreductase